ncbi:MAG TPA: glycosyltransferase family 4 protein [Fimbriiglobus sp.]|nr:glycosyltransferase family 4 protein [Fimbriiglobus sp.]
MTPWLIVASEFVPTGGMDMPNLALARHLARTGRVEVVTHRAADELARLPAVTVRRVPRPLGFDVLGGVLLGRAGLKRARRAAGARVVVNGTNCDCRDINWVHYVHSAYRRTAAGWARRLKERIVHPRRCAAERAILPASRVVVCNSHVTARDVVERVGVPADRVRVVYYGIDPDRFAPVTAKERQAARAALGWGDRPWVVFVGAMGDTRKGFDTLYAAWRFLCGGARWDANLAVVGRGAELPAWQERARADGLADRVHFLGFRPDVDRVLAAADAMAHPARYEAYGLGVHEALCRGLPVLVSATAGVAERYPPELSDLLLPDPDDTAGLADRLRAWRRDLEAWPGRVAELSAALRAITWDDMATDFVRAANTMTPCAPDRA